MSPGWYEVQGFQKPDSEPSGCTRPHKAVVPGAVAEASRRLVETQVSGLPVLQVWGAAKTLLSDAAGPGTTLRSEVPLGSRPTLLGLLVKLSPLLPASPGPVPPPHPVPVPGAPLPSQA